MKYQSLRFVIGISSFLGWAILIGGCFFTLFWAIATLVATQSGLAFFTIVIPGVAISILLGIQILALGNLYQCFIDIEENTGSTVGLLKSLRPRTEIGVYQVQPSQEAPTSGFTYMCPGCHTFQHSDVLNCLKCETDNPHHPKNQSKPASPQS
jgi:hypothetical protein